MRAAKPEASRPLTGKGSVGEKAAAAAVSSDERAQLEAEAKLDEAVRMVSPRTSREQGGDAAADAAAASRHFNAAAAEANTAGAAAAAALANMDSAVSNAAALPEYHHRRAPEAGWYGEAKRLHQQQVALNPTGGLQPPTQHGELYQREMEELQYERQGGAGAVGGVGVGGGERPLESLSLARQQKQLDEMQAGDEGETSSEVIVAASSEARPSGLGGPFSVQKA